LKELTKTVYQGKFWLVQGIGVGLEKSIEIRSTGKEQKHAYVSSACWAESKNNEWFGLTMGRDAKQNQTMSVPVI
jgi:hypothetical protein